MSTATKKRRVRKSEKRTSGESVASNAQAESNDSVAPATKVGDSDAAGLAQIRDILFGAQSRELGQRISDLSDRLVSELDELRLDLLEKVQTLQTDLNDQLQDLRDNLQSEARSRNHDIDQLEGLVHRQREELDAAIQELKASSASALADSGQDLASRIDALAKSLTDAETQLESKIAGLQNALDNSKVGRADLAVLMAEVASRLEGKS